MPVTTQNISQVNRHTFCHWGDFGEVVYKPGGVLGPRYQTGVQLVAVAKGEATVTVNQYRYHVPAGHIILLYPGTREYFEFSKDSPTHHFWCTLHPSRTQVHYHQLALQRNYVLPYTERLQTIIELGLGTPLTDTPSGETLLVQLINLAIQEFLLQATAETQQETIPPTVSRAVEYIEAHFGQPLRASQIAGKVGVSPQHLNKLFKQFLNTTTMDYVWNLRTEQGMRFLTQTGLSVSEIAFRCGFQNAFHFSRLMKNRYGASPRKLREKSWMPQTSKLNAERA